MEADKRCTFQGRGITHYKSPTEKEDCNCRDCQTDFSCPRYLSREKCAEINSSRQFTSQQTPRRQRLGERR